jgi:hypothetical protein
MSKLHAPSVWGQQIRRKTEDYAIAPVWDSIKHGPGRHNSGRRPRYVRPDDILGCDVLFNGTDSRGAEKGVLENVSDFSLARIHESG